MVELAVQIQIKERLEMEKKLQKVAKTMDHLERAKRQEEAPLIEEAFQKRLEEEKILHEQEQLVCIYYYFVAYKMLMGFNILTY
jgi:translation initiation factor 3 subunit A